MAARKLQIEIERTVKKIAEGIEIVESVFEKLTTAPNQQLKEKYETDLKKEIKKLQRYRDQIKTWAAMNEIKDKRVLLENRRLIEMQMEKFKATERELKTKAYSQAGLNAASKIDPEERERDELRTWISDMSDKLTTQIDMHEAELESQQPHTSRKGKRGDAAKSERLIKIERKIERHKHHQKMLDIVLRMLDNGKLTTDEVNNIKEDVNYYVDFNQDDEFNEDEGIYDHLNLQDAEEYGFGNEDGSEDEDESDADSPPLPSKEKESHGKSRSSKSERDHEVSPQTPVKNKPAATSKTAKEDVLSKTPVKTTQVQTRPSTTTRSSNMIPAPVDPPAPLPQRYAAAAAAGGSSNGGGVSGGTNPALSTSVSTGSMSSTTDGRQSARVSTSLPAGIIASQMSAGGTTDAASSSQTSTSSGTPTPLQTTGITLPPLASQQPKTPKKQMQAQPQRMVSESASSVTTSISPTRPSASSISASTPTQGFTDAQTQPAPLTLNASDTRHQHGASTRHPQDLLVSDATRDPTHEPLTSSSSTSSSAPPVPEALESRLPPSLADLLPSFESIRNRSLLGVADPASVQMVETSFHFRTESSDAAKSRTYFPRNPYPVPGYYPQAPLAILETNPQIFERFDVDTLFFVFYFRPGTFQQFLAARELKRQSWRFHKKYLTWFQRHEDPKAITEDYEHGTYIYFDYEDAWCQRKKTDFRFEYKYLEDEV